MQPIMQLIIHCKVLCTPLCNIIDYYQAFIQPKMQTHQTLYILKAYTTNSKSYIPKRIIKNLNPI